jgi:hypothetical protein
MTYLAADAQTMCCRTVTEELMPVAGNIVRLGVISTTAASDPRVAASPMNVTCPMIGC